MGLTTATLPLDELLPHLAERRASGTLAVETRQARKRLYLLDGQLAGVNSSDPREFLGHFLVGWGFLSEARLLEAMSLQDKLRTPLGGILLRMGAVDEEGLEKALVAQAEEAILELFLVPVLDKRFLENVLPADRPLVLRLPVPHLVLEGMHRRERQAELHAVLGGFDVVPRPADRNPPTDLSARDCHILAEIDGRRSLDAIALACHLVPFRVAEFVAQGVQDGFLSITRLPEEAPPAGPDELLADAEAALVTGDLQRCWAQLQALRAAPSDRATARRAEEVLGGIGEALTRRRIAGELIPRQLAEVPPQAHEGVGPAEAFVLSRMTAGWTLRDIQRITPLSEAHFGVVIDTLVRRKVIELHYPQGGVAVS